MHLDLPNGDRREGGPDYGSINKSVNKRDHQCLVGLTWSQAMQFARSNVLTSFEMLHFKSTINRCLVCEDRSSGLSRIYVNSYLLRFGSL